jgi:hypothetical protein
MAEGPKSANRVFTYLCICGESLHNRVCIATSAVFPAGGVSAKIVCSDITLLNSLPLSHSPTLPLPLPPSLPLPPPLSLAALRCCVAASAHRRMPAPITIAAKSEDDSSFFDDYDENDGPDIGAGKVCAGLPSLLAHCVDAWLGWQGRARGACLQGCVGSEVSGEW